MSNTLPTTGGWRANIDSFATNPYIKAADTSKSATASTTVAGDGGAEGGGGIQNIGAGVQGVAGAYGMFANIVETAKAAGETQYDIPGLMTNNPYERPTYNLGAAYAQDAAFEPQDAGKGLIGQSVMSGAGAGLAIGSMAGPWGSVIGTAAGAVTGLVGGILGRNKARKNAEEAKVREQTELSDAQGEFNDSLTDYDSTMDARDSYNKRLENRRRNIQKVVG